MAYEDFRHRVPLRVRWAEIDLQGVVFNGHYLTYCDVCITEYWRALGLAYPEDFVSTGADLYVRKATVEYHAPAVYDDELELCGRIATIGNSSLRFVVEIFRRSALASPLIGAELVYVNVDLQSRAALPVSEAFRERVRGFEAIAPEEGSRGSN